jgi:hypothetical protein
LSSDLTPATAICWLLLLFLSKWGVTDTALAQATQASGFGFRFQVGDCLTETFDSFTGVFTKDLGGEPARLVAAQLSLSESQMNTVHILRFIHSQPEFKQLPQPIGGCY